MNDAHVLINEDLLPARDASLRLSDLAITRGYGVFDFFRTLGGRPLFLDNHLDRLYRSAAALHLSLPENRSAIVERLMRVVARNGYAESGVRITVTGGYSTDGYTPATPNIIVTESPMRRDAAVAERGIKLITHEHQRQLPFAKTLDYLMAIQLQPTIRARGADDVLYHAGGVVGESPRSNFFLVTGEGVLVTPARNILEGITRKHVLALAAETMPVEVRDVSVREFDTAREAFLTSTTKRVLAVTQIDGRTIGSGMPGTISQTLDQAIQSKILKHLS